jgi:hypothetical protein
MDLWIDSCHITMARLLIPRTSSLVALLALAQRSQGFAPAINRVSSSTTLKMVRVLVPIGEGSEEIETSMLYCQASWCYFYCCPLCSPLSSLFILKLALPTPSPDSAQK